jgi:hypothetical protein
MPCSPSFTSTDRKKTSYARQYCVAVRRLQKSQLCDGQEQEEDDTTFGIQKVLSVLPETHAAQRDEVDGFQ